MAKISLLGIPHDGNSSFLQGPAEAPPADPAGTAFRRPQLMVGTALVAAKLVKEIAGMMLKTNGVG